MVYEKQLESLNNVEKSINALNEFVKNQKERLKTSQVAIEQLQEERNKLKPVLEADRKIVEALFQIQAEKQQKNIWLDRAFGFFIGVASSLVGSLVWAYAKRKRA
jgi:chromosome segregation ATPase